MSAKTARYRLERDLLRKLTAKIDDFIREDRQRKQAETQKQK
jgi:hypothetical protein